MTDEQKPEGAAPPPPPPEAEPPNRGVMIVVSYLWPLAFVPLLLEKQDAETPLRRYWTEIRTSTQVTDA